MASKTEYEMLWKLGAQLGQDFNGTFSSAQKFLPETQNEIQKLNKIQPIYRRTQNNNSR